MQLECRPFGTAEDSKEITEINLLGNNHGRTLTQFLK